MLGRLTALRIADRRDILLFTVLALALFALSIVWGLFLAQINIPFIGQNGLVFLTVIAFAAVATAVPYVTWGRGETRPIARAMIRFGIALQIFGLIVTPIGLYYETNPVISVPVGFAAFLAVFFGVFIAGFGGNMVAPPRA